MEKQKIKIWAIVILATLITVGAVATFVSKQRGLFKGFFPKSITTITDTQKIVEYLPKQPVEYLVSTNPQITVTPDFKANVGVYPGYARTVASFTIQNPTQYTLNITKIELMKRSSANDIAMNKLKNPAMFVGGYNNNVTPTKFTAANNEDGFRFEKYEKYYVAIINPNSSKTIELGLTADTTAESSKKILFKLYQTGISGAFESPGPTGPVTFNLSPLSPLEGPEFGIGIVPSCTGQVLCVGKNSLLPDNEQLITPVSGKTVSSLVMKNATQNTLTFRKIAFTYDLNTSNPLPKDRIKSIKLLINGSLYSTTDFSAGSNAEWPLNEYVLQINDVVQFDLQIDIDALNFPQEHTLQFHTYSVNIEATTTPFGNVAPIIIGTTQFPMTGPMFTIIDTFKPFRGVDFDITKIPDITTETTPTDQPPTGQGGLLIAPVQEFQPATTVNAGAADQTFVQFKIINASNQTATISKIELIKTSTSTPELNNDKFSNFKLFKGTQMIAAVPAIIVENNKNIIRWSSSTGTLVSQAIAPSEAPIYTFKASVSNNAPGDSKFIFKIDTVGIQTTVPVILPPPGVIFTIPPEFTIAASTEQSPAAGAGAGAGAIDISGGALGGVTTSTTTSTQTQSLAIESVFNAQQSVQINAGTANAVVAGFKFKNNTPQTVSISKIILIKTALSGQELSNDKISDIRLFKNGAQIAAANQLYVKFGGNFAIFAPATGSTELFSLTAGQEASIGIKAAINSSAITGSKFIFKLSEASVTANAPITALPSEFPLFGPEATITGGTAPPAPVVQKNITVSLANDTPASATVKTNEWFTVAKLSFVADGSVEINGLKVSAKENIGADALALSAIDKIQLCTSIGIAEPQCSADFIFDATGTNALFIPSWKIEEPSLMQALLIKAKLKTAAEGGKKLALGIKAVTDILGLQNVNVTAALPMYGNTMTVETPPIATLTCTNGKVAANGSCSCPAGTQEYAGGTTGTYYSPNACIPCTVAEITASGGYYCPQNLPQQPIIACANPTFTYDPVQNICVPPAGTTLAYVAPEVKCADPTFTYDPTQNVCMPPAATTTAALEIKCPDATYHYDAEKNVCVPPTVILDETTTTTPTTTTPTTTTTTTTVAVGTQEFHPAAANLAGTQKLTKAPEKSETGPGVIPYLAAVAAANGIMWWRKRSKVKS